MTGVQTCALPIFLTHADGSTYRGEFQNDRCNGKGTYAWPNGAKYVGEFKDDKPDGQGTLYGPDGTVMHSGIWKKGALVKSK